MLLTDPSAILERSLVPADLHGSGASLYRRLSQVLQGQARVGDDAFVRVSGKTSSIVVQVRREVPVVRELYFLATMKKRVQAIRIPAVAGWGVYAGEWRRRGDRIVGTFYDEIGNREAVGVAAFRYGRDRWRLATSRETSGEASRIAFSGPGLDRIVVSTPNDDFHAFVEPPHAGPHLTTDTPWLVRNSQVRIGPSRLRPTALLAFDRFVDAVQRGDRLRAQTFCRPKAFAAAWRQTRRMKNVSLRATGVHDVQDDFGRSFGFFDYRRAFDPHKQREPSVYFVFSNSQGGWRIDHLRFSRG